MRHEATSAEWPDDRWLRGYWRAAPGHRVIDDGGDEGFVRNLDFLRLRDRALLVADPGPGRTILEVGCASGAAMVYCGLQGASVYGQDLDPELVDVANRFLEKFGLEGRAVVGDVAKILFPDNTFDAVVSSDFFEHITDEEKVTAIAEIRRVLKPGGKLVVKTPNLTYLRLSMWYKRLGALLRGSDPREIVIPHTPGTDDPQHIGLTTRWDFTRVLNEAGFQNYQYFYAPLRRFGLSPALEVLSTEVPVVRDWLCEDLFCVAFKPICLSHFPD